MADKSLWERRILPGLIHGVCTARPVERQRRKVVPRARGYVLEVGFGSGLNLPHYDRQAVTRVTGLDPSAELLAKADPLVRLAPFEVERIEGSAERIPRPEASFDSIVVTYTLCSIPDAPAALSEMRRVLRPGGELIFVEHGLAPDRRVRLLQHGLNPAWRRLGGGCNLNRRVPALLEAAGFRLVELDTLYLPGARWLNYNYWGVAAPLTDRASG